MYLVSPLKNIPCISLQHTNEKKNISIRFQNKVLTDSYRTLLDPGP